MTDFKVGDRVEYVGHTSSKMKGKTGTVVDPLIKGNNLTYVEYGGPKPWGCYSWNLRLITPAPDVITIDRADLPEVSEDSNGSFIVRHNGIAYPGGYTAVSARNGALDYLALAEYLEAREQAEKEAADELARRRDELVRELSPEASRAYNHQSYDEQSVISRRAIDRIIKLQDAAN